MGKSSTWGNRKPPRRREYHLSPRATTTTLARSDHSHRIFIRITQGSVLSPSLGRLDLTELFLFNAGAHQPLTFPGTRPCWSIDS